MSALQWTSLAQTIIRNSTNGNKEIKNPLSSLPSSTSIMSPPIGVRFVSDEIKRDHRDLEILYKGLILAVDECDDVAAAALQNQFSWELARHLVAMQLFVFPGTEQRADEGNGKALRRRGDLAAVSYCHSLILPAARTVLGAGIPFCMHTDGGSRAPDSRPASTLDRPRALKSRLPQGM